MKSIILFLILTFSIGLKAQGLTKYDFKKAEWFANNENQNFYESDTIALIKILRPNSQESSLNDIYVKILYNQNRDITELNFKNRGRLIIENLRVGGWTTSKLIGKWKWKFDSKKQVLDLYFDRRLHSSFILESKNKDSIFWNNLNLIY